LSGDVEQLLAGALKALERDDAAQVEAHTNDALAVLPTGDHRRARAISIRGAGRMLSDREAGLRDMAEAAQLAQNDADVQKAYGDALLTVQMFWEAEAPLGRAVQLSSGHPDFVASYCQCLLELKKTQLAMQILDRVLKANRATQSVMRVYSQALYQYGDIYSARDVLTHLYGEAGPQSEEDRTRLARIELSLREYEPARDLLNKTLAENPESLKARLMSVTLADWTDDQDALGEHVAYLAENWRTEPDAMALIVEHSGDLNETLIAEAEALFGREGGSLDDGRISLGYALALHFDRTKQFDRAWAQACATNALFASHFNLEQTDEVRARQDEITKRRLQTALRLYDETSGEERTAGAFNYIYLVGSPRSGSTLLQSILAAPEGIGSIGERTSLYPYLAFATERDAPTTEFAQLSQRLGQAETAGLQRMGIRDPLLVEKTPHHLYVAGLLDRVNPGARFVNVLRDAGDVALSMFLRPFSAHFPEASSLASLAEMLELRIEVAQAWRDAGLDISAFSFDDFRSSPDTEGESLFQRLGLNWTPDYLDPASRPEAVTTFSARQVRKTIQSPKAPHWQSYAEFAPDEFWRLSEITSRQNDLIASWKGGGK